MKRSLFAGMALALTLAAAPAFANGFQFGGNSGVDGATSLDIQAGPGFSSSYSGVDTHANAMTTLTRFGSKSVGASNTTSYNHTRGNSVSNGTGGSEFNAGSWMTGSFRYHHPSN